MKKTQSLIVVLVIGIILFAISNCNSGNNSGNNAANSDSSGTYKQPDTNLIPKDKFGDLVRYGRDLMMRTAYYIGPEGINGHYLGNKMNCSNCHQEAGTKPFAFSLMLSHQNYPQ